MRDGQEERPRAQQDWVRSRSTARKHPPNTCAVCRWGETNRQAGGPSGGEDGCAGPMQPDGYRLAEQANADGVAGRRGGECGVRSAALRVSGAGRCRGRPKVVCRVAVVVVVAGLGQEAQKKQDLGLKWRVEDGADNNKNGDEKCWSGSNECSECWLDVAGGGVIATGQGGTTRDAVVRLSPGSGQGCGDAVPKKR